MHRKPFVAGNWKMHASLGANAALLGATREAGTRLAGVDVAVCAPFPYLFQVRDLLAGSPVAVGAQNVSEHAQGAFTGEVSAAMLAEFDCRYVIVGHSERRSLFGETDAQVAQKMAAAARAGLRPIVCVGETLAEREAGEGVPVVLRQLDAAIDAAGPEGFSSAVVAYEPVWAIGTGRNATPEQAQEIHAAIRARLGRGGINASALRIVYGGSVKPGNAAALFSMPDIDGGLIGGASLVGADFAAICEAAAVSKGH
jgi:triosephosphate isomerase